MQLPNYLRYRVYFETAFWLLLFAITFTANFTVVVMDFRRSGDSIPLWEPAVWELSSTIVLFALLPLVLVFDSKVPLRWQTFPGCLFKHFAFTLAYSLVHVGLMVGIRKAAYALAGQTYDFGSVPRELLYEYLKDFRSYFTFIGIIYLYRFILLRLQGEASLPGTQDEGNKDSLETRMPERLLIKKLGREFLIHTKEIEYIEAAGNYVNIHIGGRIYPLRETMKNISARLDNRMFRRVHRSFLVNLDYIVEIQPLDSGDAILTLSSGQKIQVSRTFRSQLAEL